MHDCIKTWLLRHIATSKWTVVKTFSRLLLSSIKAERLDYEKTLKPSVVLWIADQTKKGPGKGHKRQEETANVPL